MPLIWLGLGALGVAGLYASKGTLESMSALTKWLVLAAALYMVGKYTKVL